MTTENAIFEIFCPECGALVLDRDSCPDPACDWRRRALPGGDVGAVVWMADLGVKLNKPHCYPVVAGDLYCLGTEDGVILALDVQSGEIQWEYHLPPRVMAHALAADEQRLYVGGEDVASIPRPGRNLVALDLHGGALLWEAKTDAHSLSAAAVAEGRVYFTASDGLLRAVEAATGVPLWAVAHPTAWGPAAPIVAEGLVCAGGRGNTLVGYDALTGEERWRLSVGDARNWFAHPLYAAQGRLYALTWEDNHLHVLDLHSGEALWDASGERSRGFTTPPALGEGYVLIGSRVYRPTDEGQTEGYAMLALDAENGAERWRHYTDKHILTPPNIAGGAVFFGANDGTFCALDATQGEEQWRIQVKSRAVAQPQTAGDLVIFGGRDGLIHGLRWRAAPVLVEQDPEQLLESGEIATAAAIYALRGDIERAAELYASQLGQPKAAAQLYQHVGLLQKAAPLWAQLGELQRALKAYREAEDKAGQAQILERLGQFLEAGELHETLGNLATAARLYEQGGNRNKAAELYHKAGNVDKAIRLWRDLGEWERSAELHARNKQFVEAAEIFEAHERWERAAELYLEAKLPQRALPLFIKMTHWERVAKLAHEVGNPQQEAQAYEALHEWQHAAKAYGEAAYALRQTEADQPLSRAEEESIAALYERAALIYAEKLYDEEGEVAMRALVRRFRHLPELVVQVIAESPFIENEYNTLQLQVENRGHGIARKIGLQMKGEFDIGGECCINVVQPGKSKTLEVTLRPRKENFGKVPLTLEVTYLDMPGNHYELQRDVWVVVMRPGIPGLGTVTTPTNLNVTIYQPGSRRVEGGEVNINRGLTETGEGLPVRSSIISMGDELALTQDGRVSVRPVAEQVRRCPTCNLPTSDPEQHYCSDCGTPLPPVK